MIFLYTDSMGICSGKPIPTIGSNISTSVENTPEPQHQQTPRSRTQSPARKNTPREQKVDNEGEEKESSKPWASPFFPFYTPSPGPGFFSSNKSPSSGCNSKSATPNKFFKRPFPPPSPAKHIKALLARRHGSVKPNEAAIPEDGEVVVGTGLDKNFGFFKGFESKYEVGEEVGRGHFGYTCSAKFKKGDRKGQRVAVKVIPKAKVCLAV